MQLVIEIPDYVYQIIIDKKYTMSLLEKAIRKGIKLPKYHGDLKDVNTFSDEGVLPYDPGALGTLWNSIDNAPVLVPACNERRMKNDNSTGRLYSEQLE